MIKSNQISYIDQPLSVYMSKHCVCSVISDVKRFIKPFQVYLMRVHLMYINKKEKVRVAPRLFLTVFRALWSLSTTLCLALALWQTSALYPDCSFR